MLLDVDRQMERWTGRLKKGGQHRGVLKDREGDTKMVFLRNKKGQIALFPHSCHSVFNLSLKRGVQGVGRSL
jgi:hypothetical protein